MIKISSAGISVIMTLRGLVIMAGLAVVAPLWLLSALSQLQHQSFVWSHSVHEQCIYWQCDQRQRQQQPKVDQHHRIPRHRVTLETCRQRRIMQQL